MKSENGPPPGGGSVENLWLQPLVLQCHPHLMQILTGHPCPPPWGNATQAGQPPPNPPAPGVDPHRASAVQGRLFFRSEVLFAIPKLPETYQMDQRHFRRLFVPKVKKGSSLSGSKYSSAQCAPTNTTAHVVFFPRQIPTLLILQR